MQYINRLSDYRDSKESAVTFGKFDGLHKGHQKLIEKVQEFGRQEDLASIVCVMGADGNHPADTYDGRGETQIS